MKRCLAIAVCLFGCAGNLSDPASFVATPLCPDDVQADILVPRCALSGCHRPGDPPAGLEYVTYGLRDRLVGVEAQTCPDTMRINPNDVGSSHLIARISPNPTCAGMTIDRMPLAHTPLSDDEIACVTGWVNRLVSPRDQ